MKAVLAIFLAWSCSPAIASACERCFGAGSDSPIVTAISLSMFALVVVTALVLTGVTKFFRDMTRRARSLEDSGYVDGVSGNGHAHRQQ